MTETMSFALPMTALSPGPDTLTLLWKTLGVLGVLVLLTATAAALHPYGTRLARGWGAKGRSPHAHRHLRLLWRHESWR